MASVSPDLPGGPSLAGQVVVFTGKLGSLSRREARALVARLGGETSDDVSAKTTMLVVGAEGFSGGVEKSGKLRRADELNAQSPDRIAIVSEDEFCRIAGVPSPEALRRQYHSHRDVLNRYRFLSDVQLRYLEKCGILSPVLRTNAETFYAFQDLPIVRQVNEDLSQGMPFKRIIRALMAERAGQLALDFRIDAAPAKVIALSNRPSRPGPATRRDVTETALAEEYFLAGSELDDGTESQREAAAAAYRKALEADPYLVPALINLANIHYTRDELVEAQALYERAIGLEPDAFEAHFNLGNIYHDLRRYAEAQACYREALRLNPAYADAHFYLAVTFEKLGLSDEARPHWKAYQRLAPNGEWVELAREFSD